MASAMWITSSLRQTWCSCGVLFGVIGEGMILGHTGYLMSALQASDSSIKTDIHAASWLASVTGPAVFVGIVLSCMLMDKYGRRWAYLISVIPGILGWTFLYLAQNYAMLAIGRLLTGTSAGCVLTVGVIVIGEYTSPQNRGMFLNLKTAALTMGSAIAHILSTCMHWRTIAIIALIPHVIALLITCTWPESPTWLATRKQFEKCEQDFFWLRGRNEKSVKEFSELIKAQKERLLANKKEISVKGKISEILNKTTRKDFLKPFFTLTISFFLMEASGRHYFPTYALQIMNKAMNTKISPFYYTLCIDMIIIVSSMISSILIRMVKRRTLLFSTGIASLIVLLCMCIYLFLVSTKFISNVNSWLITFIFVVYFFITHLACVPIPIALQGELFPVAHRELGSGIFGMVVSLIFTAVIKVTPHLLIATEVYGTFAIYGAIMAASLIVLYFILPETKDRTLQEIENYYNHGRFTNIDEITNLLVDKTRGTEAAKANE